MKITITKKLFNLTLAIALAATLALPQESQAKPCDERECHFEIAPTWLIYPDLTPISMEVYRDAGGNSERDILICLTIANVGVGTIMERDTNGNRIEFDINKQMGSQSETYETTVAGPLPGFLSPNNTMSFEFDPRVGSNDYNSGAPIPITIILDADEIFDSNGNVVPYHDIEERNEFNNQITVLYDPATADSRTSCEDHR